MGCNMPKCHIPALLKYSVMLKNGQIFKQMMYLDQPIFCYKPSNSVFLSESRVNFTPSLSVSED